MACGHFKCHRCWLIPQQQSSAQTGGIELSFQYYTTDISMTNIIYNKWMHSKKPMGLKAQLSRVNIFREWNKMWPGRLREIQHLCLFWFFQSYVLLWWWWWWWKTLHTNKETEEELKRGKETQAWLDHLPTDFILVFRCHPQPEALAISNHTLAYPHHNPVS